MSLLVSASACENRGGHELLDLDSGNQTWVLCKGSTLC